MTSHPRNNHPRKVYIGEFESAALARQARRFPRRGTGSHWGLGTLTLAAAFYVIFICAFF